MCGRLPCLLARGCQFAVYLGWVSATASEWSSGSPSHPIHLTSALSFSFPLSFFPTLPHQAQLSSSPPSSNSTHPSLFFSIQSFISPPSVAMASRVLASRMASMAQVARPAMRVQVANVSKRTITGKGNSPHLELIVAQPVDLNVIDPNQ